MFLGHVGTGTEQPDDAPTGADYRLDDHVDVPKSRTRRSVFPAQRQIPAPERCPGFPDAAEMNEEIVVVQIANRLFRRMSKDGFATDEIMEGTIGVAELQGRTFAQCQEQRRLLEQQLETLKLDALFGERSPELELAHHLPRQTAQQTLLALAETFRPRTAIEHG